MITQDQLDAAMRDHCPQIGTGGYHSAAFYDDGCCAWCGSKPREGVEYARDPYPDDPYIEMERVIADTAARRERIKAERRSFTIEERYDLGGESG
jgi:hypothetical protein